ncbi:MAG TPA: hypothetical protein VN207_02470 [Ktedonobacteraceae bacterium]|nr:hypothetical protein [Ktedonobacteraceae bacterium]
MRTLRWGFHKARIWLDELPTWDYQSLEVVEQSSDVSKSRDSKSKKGAVEVYAPIGPIAYYGALGATFTPQDIGRVTIRVPISEDKGPLREASLAGKTDEVHLGLPQEYIGDIINGFLNADTIQQLGAGMLRICCGAHGTVGSSPWIFGALSRILTKLLLLEDTSVSDESLIKLIRGELIQKETSTHTVITNFGIQMKL